MSFCSFSRDSAMFGSTPIENMFLLEYLPHVPEDCLRVYLYARLLCHHPEMGSGVEDICKALRMDEDTVLEAFRFWEQQGLVEKMTDRPPSYAFRSLNSGVIARENDDVRKHMDYNFEVLKILDVTSIGSKQTRMAFDWMDVLGFSQDAALELLRYEKKIGGDFSPATIINHANKRAFDWAERGIHSLEDVQRAIAYDDQVYAIQRAVFRQLAINRKPTNNELDCIRRWVHEWKLGEADILAACEKTTKSRAPSVGYLDAILRARVESGGDRHFESVKAILKELGASNTVPTPDQIKKYAALLDTGFEPEAVLLAAVQCARKRKHSFEELEWMIGKWGEAGVRTHAQAERYLSDMQRTTAEVRTVLEAAGLSRRPNMDDLEKYESWRAVHGQAMIICAAECARGTRVPVKYMDKLLTEWKAAGISTPEAAKAQHAAFRPAQAAQPAAGASYGQRTETDTTYGKNSYSDPTKDLE